MASSDEDALERATRAREDDIARVLGTNRQARRDARARLDADEALARRLQREEDEAYAEEAARRDVRAAQAGTNPFAGFMEDVLGAVRGAVDGEVERGTGRRARAGDGDARRDDARGDDGDGRGRFTLEIPIGSGGETLRIDPAAMFGDEDASGGVAGFGGFDGFDEAFRRLGAPGSILDMLNAMQGMNWGGRGGGGGMRENERAAMPTETYARGADENENETCSVCLSQMETGEEAKRLGCKHVYHPACIDRWLERSRLCPVCKRDVCAAR
jgi:hypothetical protein